MARGTASLPVNINGIPGSSVVAPVQPLVVLGSGVAQPQPPQTGFFFPGVHRNITLSGTPSSTYWICAGADHNIWATQSSGTGSVWRVGLDGSTTQFNFDGTSAPDGLSVGPDDNIWVADNTKVHRVTSDGTITDFDVSGAFTLTSCCAVEDGFLWATSYGDGVFKIDPSDGSSTKVTTGGANWICSGGDGTVWVVAPGSYPSDGVMRQINVATGAIMQTLSVPLNTTSSNGSPAICLGPDNNIWGVSSNGAGVYPDLLSNAIRVTPDGEITTFTADISMNPDSEEGPGFDGICTGAGGDLWIADNAGQALWKLTPDGEYTAFHADDIIPWGICTGWDGSLWTANYGGQVTVWPFDVVYPGLEIAQGGFSVANMPTADPHVTGTVWNHSGVLTVSAG